MFARVLSFIPADQVQTRINSLRTQYGKCVRMVPEGSPPLKELTTKQQWLINSLSWMKPHIKARRSISHVEVGTAKPLLMFVVLGSSLRGISQDQTGVYLTLALYSRPEMVAVVSLVLHLPLENHDTSDE